MYIYVVAMIQLDYTTNKSKKLDLVYTGILLMFGVNMTIGVGLIIVSLFLFNEKQ